MRKNDRDGIVELITSIEEAMDYCRSVDYNTSSVLIEDCEAAISSILGILKSQLTDSSRVSYNTIVGNLESVIKIFHNAKISPIPIETYDSTKRSLYILRKKLLKEDVQYEVVFLPYNATMWDSLESIWMAAKEDPRCIPYVIPIPYYDKNKDGLLGEMHYDGELFPDYVPITHYNQYDIERRKPEIIYIHNPYDKFNKVTSVHPMYYSNNLKKYTNMLVYVPYFIVMDYLAEDFAIMPGVRFADKVIAQSEQIAEQYKKYYPGEDKDKFLTLGSPKIDKVLQMSKLNREELNLPEEWKNRIGNKKVILYNTHLDNIMNRGELLIKKLRYVFSCFENRDDVVLLWRPHPLSENTAAAMNPAILEDYKKIEAEYKEKRIGIYDDTPDLHRSVALADAYYGDWSSLVPMFGVMGKPIMIQDINENKRRADDEVRRIPFEDAYIDGDNMWFSSSSFNGLFCMNRKTGKTEYKGYFQEENMGEIRLYSKVIRYNNKLIFVPFNADAIAEYDMTDGSIRKIEIKDKEIKRKFLSCAIYNGYIYFMPRTLSSIFRYNIELGTVEYMHNLDEAISKYIIDKNDVVFRDVFLKENRLYCPLGQNSIIMIFNLDTLEMDVVKLQKENDGFLSIQYDGENFWLLSRKRCEIACWNEKNNTISYINDFLQNNEYEDTVDLFLTTLYKDGDIWILPCRSKAILKLDTKTKELKHYYYGDKLDSDFLKYKMFWKFGGISSRYDEIMMYQLNTDAMLILDKSGDVKYKQQVVLPDNWNSVEIITYAQRDEYNNFMEGYYGVLEIYIDYVSKSKSDIEQIKNVYSEKLFGNNIEMCGERLNNYFLR